MENNHHEWLVDWFSQQGEIPDDLKDEILDINYFEAGLIDSMAVILLITDIESHFEVSFTERHFQDRRFSTIGGISEIIAEIKQMNG